MFGSDPGPYSAAAYACTQAILQALAAVGNDRESVRAYVTDSRHSFTPVLGTLSFDANGDTTHPVVSYYRYDPATRDWAFFREKDFGAGG